MNNKIVKYFFLNWQTNDQATITQPDHTEFFGNSGAYYTSPVIFHGDNAQVTAVYKGHLASSVARATGYNNGRRITKAQNGKMYLVYEDRGVIYYASSDDDGHSWSDEQALSDDSPDMDFVNPSITTYDNKLFAAWVSASGMTATVYYASMDLNDGNPVWSVETVDIADNDASVNTPATSITILKKENSAVYYPYIAAGFYHDNTYEIQVWLKDNGYWEIESFIDGKNPSISADTYHVINNEQMYLSYDRDNTVYLKSCYWSNGVKVWTNESAVSQDDDDIQNIGHSSVSAMDGYAHIVWQGLNTDIGKYEVYYRMSVPEEGVTISSTPPPNTTVPWNTITVISNLDHDITNPTIGVVEDQSATIYYQQENSIYKRKFKEQNQVYGAGNGYYYDGRYPSIAEHVLQGSFCTQYSAAPFVLKSDADGPDGSQPGYYDPGWGSVNKTLSADANGGQEGHVIIDFLDCTYGGDTLTFNQALRTDSFAVSGDNVPLNLDMKAVFKTVNNLPGDENVIFQLNYVDGTDTLFMTDLTYGELPSNPAPDGERFFKLTTIVNLGTRQGHFAFKLLDSDIAVRRIIRTLDEQSQSKSKAPLAVTPVSYILHQNFPNPFNPSTHITAELPQAGNMSLAVYNVKGQKVKDLLSGWQNAGIYEVVFDGSGLASGVYFYRLQAGNVVQTRRMLLVK